eukprot:PITA_18624
MGSSLKANAVRDLLKFEQPDLLLLQETKISDQEFHNHTKRNKNYSGTSISAAGASGGIGTIWNKNKWELINQNSHSWWVRTDIQNKASKEDYTIYNIYAPNHYRDKASCWDTITTNLLSVQGRNIFLGGDLNLIRNADEKLGGNFYADPSRDSLETIIQTHNLVDIPPQNGRFTWSNKRIGNNNLKERLDRILFQEGIVASFPNIKSKIIQGYTSDHKPVALTLDKGRIMGPLPFKYNKAWDSKEEFQNLIQEQWEKEVIEENKKRTDLHKQLEQSNQENERIQYTEEDQSKENEMYKELYRQNRMEEDEQRQKSQCLWLKAGDKNISFFHNSLKLRRAGNQIERIMVEGKEIRDQEEIKEATYRHFKSLLSADPQPQDNAEFLSPIENKISDSQNKELDQEVTEEEIKFIKSSHLALIPKDPNPLSFDRFTKILANRLKNLLPFLISENQGGFVPSRQITDNVILIQEAIRSSISRNERGMIIKLDMENAFDRVNHHFLKEVLRKFGISNNFISIIMECITHPWTAPLINGRPSNYFRSSKGLRQGCPLSPFLYIIMAETLSIHLEKLRMQKEITGISIVRGTKGINHSLFADDTLLIGGASSLMAKRFKKMLDPFLLASGGKLNNKKCNIYTWNVPWQIIQIISSILDIPTQRNWSYFMYLGLPLAKESVKSEIWVKLIEKSRGKLQSWGMTWLNLAGRTTLIKAILSALPIYQFAVTLAPASTNKHMEIIIRSFLWQGGKQDSKNFSLVKWDQVTLPFEKGGL